MANDTFVGRTVTGDISHYSERSLVEQWDEQAFIDRLDTLLDTPGVDSVRWNQYTPYFNDGDACVFGIGEAYIKPVDGEEEAGDYEDGYLSTYELPDGEKYNRELNKFDKVDEDTTLYKALKKFEGDLGHFEDVLHKAFGDPATVTATKAGFDVEFFDHD